MYLKLVTSISNEGYVGWVGCSRENISWTLREEEQVAIMQPDMSFNIIDIFHSRDLVGNKRRGESGIASLLPLADFVNEKPYEGSKA